MSVADPFPPPGLYRIDTDAQIRSQGTVQRITQQGTSGRATVNSQAPGRADDIRNAQGESPKNFCMGPRSANGGLLPPASSCRGAKLANSANGATYTMQCGFADITTVVRKLNATTWEYRVSTVEHQGGGEIPGLPSFAQQKAMFAVTAKNGATAEDRAQAQYNLSHWDEYVAKARAEAAEMAKEDAALGESAGASATLARTSTSIHRLVRIGDTCTPTKGALPLATHR